MKKSILYLLAIVSGLYTPFLYAADQPVSSQLEISAEGAFEWRREVHQYIARGNVIANQGDMTLIADEVIATYHEDKGAPQIDQLIATGNITIKTRAEIATGSKAVYDHNSQTAILEGPVTITRGKNVLTGARARVDLKTGTSTLMGGGGKNRVTGVFYTSQEP